VLLRATPTLASLSHAMERSFSKRYPSRAQCIRSSTSSREQDSLHSSSVMASASIFRALAGRRGPDISLQKSRSSSLRLIPHLRRTSQISRCSSKVIVAFEEWEDTVSDPGWRSPPLLRAPVGQIGARNSGSETHASAWEAPNSTHWHMPLLSILMPPEVPRVVELPITTKRTVPTPLEPWPQTPRADHTALGRLPLGFRSGQDSPSPSRLPTETVLLLVAGC